MGVDLDSGYECTLGAVKCHGSVGCYCLPPCVSQLRHEAKGAGGGVILNTPKGR